MPADKFWQIIERAARADHDPDAHMEALRTELRTLTLEEIIAFEVAFRRYLNEAYTWDLCGTACVIHGTCTDDSFEYFRRWLVSRGRDVYEAALADPRQSGATGCTATRLGVGSSRRSTTSHWTSSGRRAAWSSIGASIPEPEAGTDGHELTGEPLEEGEAHLAWRYPKLWQRFATDTII